MNNQERYFLKAQAASSSLLKELAALDDTLTRTRLSANARQQLTLLRQSLQRDAYEIQFQLDTIQKASSQRPVIPILDLICH